MKFAFLPTHVASGAYPLQLPLGERWRLRHRLVELGIPAVCTEDGGLQVDIQTPLAVLQVGSVIRQHMASRQELVQSLKACWQLQMETGGEDGQGE